MLLSTGLEAQALQGPGEVDRWGGGARGPEKVNPTYPGNRPQTRSPPSLPSLFTSPLPARPAGEDQAQGLLHEALSILPRLRKV